MDKYSIHVYDGLPPFSTFPSQFPLIPKKKWVFLSNPGAFCFFCYRFGNSSEVSIFRALKGDQLHHSPTKEERHQRCQDFRARCVEGEGEIPAEPVDPCLVECKGGSELGEFPHGFGWYIEHDIGKHSYVLFVLVYLWVFIVFFMFFVHS